MCSLANDPTATGGDSSAAFVFAALLMSAILLQWGREELLFE